MALPKLLKLLGTLLGGTEITELRQKALETSVRTKKALNRAREAATQATQEVAQRHVEEKQTQTEYQQTARRQAPKIVRALARERRTGRLVQRRQRQFRQLRSTLGVQDPATQGAHDLYKDAVREHQRARLRVAKERKPVEQSQARRTKARVATARAESRQRTSERLVHRRERDRNKAAKKVREFTKPQARPRLILEGLRGRDISGAAVRGMATGGPMGAAAAGGGQAAAGVAEGMALAFGGPYGPLLRKGITMFTDFISIGAKAGEALAKFKDEADAKALSYAHASPSMAAVELERQFNDYLEDLKKGESQAKAEQIRNRERVERQRAERIATINQEFHNKMVSARTEAAEEIRGKTSESLIKSGHDRIAYILNLPVVSHVFDLGARTGTYFSDSDISQKVNRDVAELEKQRLEAIKQAEEQLRREELGMGKELNGEGGFFKTIGEGSPIEEAIRLGMGGHWAEDVGLPNRFK